MSVTVDIAKHIVENFNGELMELRLNEKAARAVRKNVYILLKEKGLQGTLNLIVKSGELLVMKPEKSYVKKLEDLLKKVMFSLENEDLFNECLNLLEENHA